MTLSKQILLLKSQLRIAKVDLRIRNENQGKIWSLQKENGRLQSWVIDVNKEKSQWESTARGTVGLVLAYMQQHGHWDKSTSCDLCRQAEKVLKSLGFQLQSQPPPRRDVAVEVTNPRQNFFSGK